MKTYGPAWLPLATKMVIDCVVIELWLRDGRVLFVPTKWFPRIENATQQQRENFRFVEGGKGIHWPDLDEDLSVAGMLMPR